jgi:hypothetical protein
MAKGLADLSPFHCSVLYLDYHLFHMSQEKVMPCKSTLGAGENGYA